MAALYILVCLLLLLLLMGYICFRLAIRRGEERDVRDPQFVEYYPKMAEPQSVKAGMDWLREQPMEDIWLESFDRLRLHASLLPAQRKSRGVLLCFNGYRSYVWYDFSCAVRYYHGLGYDLLLIDQRCTSQSQGRYIGFGALERHDAKAWAAYAAARFGFQTPLFLLGISMGATTVLLSTALSLPASVRGILADCGFTSPAAIIREVLRKRYHLPAFPLLYLIDLFSRLLAGYSLFSCSTPEVLAGCDVPILFIHGTGDSFVPCRMSQEAYAACGSPKRLLLVEGARHGLSFLKDQNAYSRAVEAFFREYGS